MSKQRCIAEADTEALERKSPTLANVRSILGCPRLVSALIICGMICAGSFLLVWDQLKTVAEEVQAMRLEFSVRMKAVETRMDSVTGIVPPPKTQNHQITLTSFKKE